MEWLKWHIGSAIDPKFSIVARRSGHNVAAVIAIWAMLLERACQAEERGNIRGFDCEAADVALGLPDGAACAIIDALQSKGLIHGDRVANWEKRQNTDVTEAARERKRLQREREKLEAERLALERRIAEMQAMGLADGDSHAQSQNVTEVTPGHRGSHDVTYKKREDKKRENTSPPVESLVNQDRACAREEPQRRGEALPFAEQDTPGQRAVDPVDLSGPGMEFLELREFYTREVKPEGPLDGFDEYKQLKAARDPTGTSVFPGLSRILDDLAARKAAGVWNPGYEIGLARYLKTRTWLAPIQSRASPPSEATPTEFQRQQQDRRNMMRMAKEFRERERAAKQQAQGVQHGQRAATATPPAALD